MEKINIHRVPAQPLIRTKSSKQQMKPLDSFQDQLTKVLSHEPLKISKHASDRLNQRNIHITEAEWAKVTEKVNEAKQKGIKESLVLMEKAALIVSAKNATVITAMDRMEAKDQLFTNIDGTIVLA